MPFKESIIFVRTYRCNSCHECSSRQGEAGDATLWTDCDRCKGPAHWCYRIPCPLCVIKVQYPTDQEVEEYWKPLLNPEGSRDNDESWPLPANVEPL